jgi:hypothetical protein
LNFIKEVMLPFFDRSGKRQFFSQIFSKYLVSSSSTFSQIAIGRALNKLDTPTSDIILFLDETLNIQDLKKVEGDFPIELTFTLMSLALYNNSSLKMQDTNNEAYKAKEDDDLDFDQIGRQTFKFAEWLAL